MRFRADRLRFTMKRRTAKEMKKMTFGIVFIIVVALLVFVGCVKFTKGEIVVDNAEELALDEYETIIASALDIPVTNASGEAETDESGKALTTSVLVEEMTVPVTNEAGESVTDASGEQQTTKIYVDKNTGRVISGSTGEVKTTQVFKDKKTGEIVVTTAKAETTSKSDTQSTTLAPNELNTTKPADAADTGANEFEYLRNGNFYIQGVMTDTSGESLPLEMAVTPNSVYMLSNFEGSAMGMLVNDGTTYMIYPAEKAYLELSATVLKAMGMSTTDLISAADLDYSQYDLANADSTSSESVNGTNCSVYIYNSSSGSTRFFMNGNKLVRFATYDANGNPETVNDISYITDQVPADKINPPADYKEYKGITGMFSFINLLGDVVGE